MEQLRINNLQHNKTLGEVLKENGVSINEFEHYWEIANTELIGEGMNGKVFNIGNNKVLKISTDEKEYSALNYLENELYKDKNLWYKHLLNLPLLICPVNENFSVFATNDINYRYYFIFEKLYELSEYEKNIFNEISEFYNTNYFEECQYDEGDESDIEEYIKRTYPNFTEYYIIEFLINVFNFVLETDYEDIHLGNIMKDSNGDYKLIDLRL